MDDEVVEVLEDYDWPGNVRELRNATERMAILTAGDRITADSVPFEIRAPRIGAPSDLHQARDDAERQRILHALDETDWNVSGAARLLGIERTSLHKRMKTLKIGRTGRERRG